MKQYRNKVWDLIDIFFIDFNISHMPRSEKKIVDSLATAASGYQPLYFPYFMVETGVKNIPSIQQIKKFMEMIDEFFAVKIEGEDDQMEECKDEKEPDR